MALSASGNTGRYGTGTKEDKVSKAYAEHRTATITPSQAKNLSSKSEPQKSKPISPIDRVGAISSGRLTVSKSSKRHKHHKTHKSTQTKPTKAEIPEAKPLTKPPQTSTDKATQAKEELEKLVSKGEPSSTQAKPTRAEIPEARPKTTEAKPQPGKNVFQRIGENTRKVLETVYIGLASLAGGKPQPEKTVIHQAWERYEKGLANLAGALEKEAEKHLAFERYEPLLGEGTIPQHLFMKWTPQPGQPKTLSELIYKSHEKEFKEYKTAAERYNAVVERYRQKGLINEKGEFVGTAEEYQKFKQKVKLYEETIKKHGPLVERYSSFRETEKKVGDVYKPPAGYEAAREFFLGMTVDTALAIPSMPLFVASLLTKPRKTAEEMGQFITEHPHRFAGQLIGTTLLFKGIGKAVEKTSEAIRFAGKEHIPIEKLTQPEVVTGKYPFPRPEKIGSGEAIVKQFYKSKSTKWTDIGKEAKVSGFHATPEAGGIVGLGKGDVVHSAIYRPKDMPGLYIAPDVSPHFLRIAGEAKYSLIPRLSSLESLFVKPGILHIGLEAVERLPKDVRYNIARAQEWMKTRAERGKAYVTPEAELGKPEAEAVISPGTELINVRGEGLIGGKFKYYTKWQGKKVPIYELEALRETLKEATEQGARITREARKIAREEAKTLERWVKDYELKPETRWIGRDVGKSLTPFSRYGRGRTKYRGSPSEVSRVMFGESGRRAPFYREPFSEINRLIFDEISEIDEITEITSIYKPPSEMDSYPPYSPPGFPPYTPPYTPPSFPPYSPPSIPTPGSPKKKTTIPPWFPEEHFSFWDESYGYEELKHAFPSLEEMLFGKKGRRRR